MKPPIHLPPTERAIWREIIKASCVPITEADRFALEILVSLLCRQRDRLKLFADERATMLKLLQEFRCTPGSRAKMTEPQGFNEFSTL